MLKILPFSCTHSCMCVHVSAVCMCLCLYPNGWTDFIQFPYLDLSCRAPKGNRFFSSENGHNYYVNMPVGAIYWGSLDPVDICGLEFSQRNAIWTTITRPGCRRAPCIALLCFASLRFTLDTATVHPITGILNLPRRVDRQLTCFE